MSGRPDAAAAWTSSICMWRCSFSLPKWPSASDNMLRKVAADRIRCTKSKSVANNGCLKKPFQMCEELLPAKGTGGRTNSRYLNLIYFAHAPCSGTQPTPNAGTKHWNTTRHIPKHPISNLRTKHKH